MFRCSDDKMKKCKEKINKKKCGYDLVDVFLPLCGELGKWVQYCKNPRCSNYYRCSCGTEFGKHFINNVK